MLDAKGRKYWLYKNKRNGCRFDETRNLWFITYEVDEPNGKREKVREYLPEDVRTKEEACEARDRKYARMLMNGAQWKEHHRTVWARRSAAGKKARKKKVRLKDYIKDRSQFLTKIRTVIHKYEVNINGKKLGTFSNYREATRVRDRYITRHMVNPENERRGYKAVGAQSREGEDDADDGDTSEGAVGVDDFIV